MVTPTRAATRRRLRSSVRPPATAPRRAAATRTRAIVSHPAATRRPAASPATGAVTTAVRRPRRGRRTTAARNPGRLIPIRAAIRRSRAAATRIRATAARHYGRQDYAQPDYGRYGEPPAGGGYAEPGYGEPAGGGYDYGPPAGAPGGGYGGYGQADYPPGGAAVTLQLDDGSGRTYQLREGANVIGRGQDAQFRLPDTGVSRRHLEIRWDGQVALLADLNSTNGTTVNNAPVQEWQLADGDVIRLGHSEIIVRVH